MTFSNHKTLRCLPASLHNFSAAVKNEFHQELNCALRWTHGLELVMSASVVAPCRVWSLVLQNTSGMRERVCTLLTKSVISMQTSFHREATGCSLQMCLWRCSDAYVFSCRPFQRLFYSDGITCVFAKSGGSSDVALSTLRWLNCQPLVAVTNVFNYKWEVWGCVCSCKMWRQIL